MSIDRLIVIHVAVAIVRPRWLPHPKATHTPNPSQTPPEPPASRASSRARQPRMNGPASQHGRRPNPKRMGSALGQLLPGPSKGLLAAAAASRAGRSIIAPAAGAAAAPSSSSRRMLGYVQEAAPKSVRQSDRSIDRSIEINRSTGQPAAAVAAQRNGDVRMARSLFLAPLMRPSRPEDTKGQEVFVGARLRSFRLSAWGRLVCAKACLCCFDFDRGCFTFGQKGVFLSWVLVLGITNAPPYHSIDQ